MHKTHPNTTQAPKLRSTSSGSLQNAVNEFIEPRLLRGDEPYMLTLMFKPLRGNDTSVARQMDRVAENLYARLLTRLIKKPKNVPILQMPLWLSCHDWPVQKIKGISSADILLNGGRHLHAMMFVPPTVRTGVRLNDIVAKNPQQFLVGKYLTGLHVMPIERTVAKATGYALKSVERGRVGWGDVLVLPKTHAEMGHTQKPGDWLGSVTVEEYLVRLAAWGERSRREAMS